MELVSYLCCAPGCAADREEAVLAVLTPCSKQNLLEQLLRGELGVGPLRLCSILCVLIISCDQ